MKIKKILTLSVFLYDFIVLLNFLLSTLDGYPQKQAGVFSFLMLLFFGIVLLIINPKSQIDNSLVIPNNIHNFLIVLIFVLFFLINMKTILFLFTNLIKAIHSWWILYLFTRKVFIMKALLKKEITSLSVFIYNFFSVLIFFTK